MIRIDAHHHVWELGTRPHAWLDGAGMAAIRRDFTLADLAPLTAAAGIDRTILVQALPSLTEKHQPTVRSSMAWRGPGVRIPSAPQGSCRSEAVSEPSLVVAAQLGASRRGYGEDDIYVDHPGRLPGQRSPQDVFWPVARGGLARLCRGRKRIGKKVSGQTRIEVKDKLKALHSGLDAGVRTAAGYTVEMAVTDWLAEGTGADASARLYYLRRNDITLSERWKRR